MAKILLVEKRYDGTEEEPSLTARWIEVPDGEEELFLVEQLKNVSSINVALQKKEKENVGEIMSYSHHKKESFLQDKTMLILNLLPFFAVAIGATIAFVSFSYYGVWK
jgi:hypothetical protein